ncbi:MAG: hypothetical protein K940chlam1_01335, partial [Candidatus Anoxychlamydiales bacterium]|nr:hypothetical protein [Candidatus Anoxychlamydiales bacterium]
HLRPGTYDLLSPNYQESPNTYFDWNEKKDNTGFKKNKFVLSLDQMKKIEKLLKQHNLNHNIISFFDFIKSAIEGREYAKFVFTKSLSHILHLFKEFAHQYDFDENNAVYSNIEIIKKLYESSSDHKAILESSIIAGKNIYEYTKLICLPPIIANPDDIFAFHIPSQDPNFITLSKVKGKTILVDEDKKMFKNSILFIESADPGYDWIFSQKIIGFITKYGGANSHMAIRAAELEIPAIIGAGESLYNKWSRANFLEIDCANKTVHIIK